MTATDWSYQHPDRSAPALDGLNLTVSRGEKVLLAGPSGAGKSTLLHALAGVLQGEGQAEGTLELDGLDPSQARGRAGLMQQDPESQVVLSRLGDDVAFSCENLAVPSAEIPQRVQQALDDVGLGHLPYDHPTAHLSGGQKQRLALAGILAMQPGLLLLDEPTGHCDPDGVEQVRDAVMAAAEASGATVIIIEHRLQVWAPYVDTLVTLEPGGGLRHRVVASAIYNDAALRSELADAGLWVPASTTPDPEIPAPSRSARGIPHPGSPLPSADDDALLLAADQLSVHRQSPKKSWRRVPPPQPVLGPVSMEFQPSTATAITGPNGSGKSTLMLTLAGMIAAHGGSVRAGQQLKGPQGGQLSDTPYQWRSADLTSRIGLVFQEPEHQFVRSTVSEELRLSADQARLPGSQSPLFTPDEVEERVTRLLQRLWLTDLAEANPFTLSGGEKRRLSVGTALAAGPDVLILDEPTFGQDAHTFAELAELLLDHVAMGGTVIAVTHDVAFAEALSADRIDITQFSPADTEFSSTGVVDSSARISTTPQETTARISHDASASSAPLLGAFRSRSWLGRRGPLAKLLALFIITAALVVTIDPVSAAVVAVASFLLLPVAGIRLLTFCARVWPFFIGAVLAVWGTAVAAEESGDVVWDLGFTTVSTGSIELGIAIGLRAIAIVLPSVLVFSTTDPTDLADSLAQQLQFPARFVLGALAAMRLLGLLAEHWTTLGHARRARGLKSQFFSQAFGLLVQAIRMATRLAVTMESRGFGAGPRSWARPTSFTASDAVLVAGALLLAATATGLALTAGTWNLVWTD